MRTNMKCKLPWSKALVWFEVHFKQTVSRDREGEKGRDTEWSAGVTEEDKGGPEKRWTHKYDEK